jgi:hypothetical protein
MTVTDLGVQLFLYTIGTTGTVEVSDDGVAWVSATLPTPLPVEDALPAWKTAADAALATRVFTFAMNAAGVITISATGGATYYRMSQTLADLLGLYLTGSLPVSSTVTPLGYLLPGAAVPVGRTMVHDQESGEITEYRAGRVTSYQWGRVRMVELDFFCPASLRAVLVEGPLLSGHGKVRVRLADTGDPYAYGTLAGYLDVYPVEVLDTFYIEGTDDEIGVKIRATLEDDDLGAAFLARFSVTL